MNEHQKDELVEQAVLGKQVDDFLSTGVGKFLLAKAEQEYILALTALADCDANNVTIITKLQSEAKMASNFRSWLKESVIAGLKAIEILEDRE